jgi:diaminohydroxyphosphoribosylaminopyrimidine deaminase/5-amino-6-(5-phosphoribosylamino)uracil reductase
MEAIIVGAQTVRADDPRLTARPPGPRTATRVVLSSNGLLPVGCRLLEEREEAPVLIATTSEKADCPAVRRQSFEILGLPTWEGRPDVLALLAELGRRRFTNVLVEGGAQVLGSFRDAGLIDEVHVFVAPRLIGGQAALGPIGGAGAAPMSAGITFSECTCEVSGPDWYFHGRTRQITAQLF